MPVRGLVMKPGKFNRQPQYYLALLIRHMRQDDTFGEWQPVSSRGFVVLCPNEHELHEFARWLGPRIGFPPPHGYVDDQYDEWLFDGPMRKMNYGRPKGKREMMWGELVSGWVPPEQSMRDGTASPMITDGTMERRPGPPTFSETLAAMTSASMAL